MGLHMSYDLSRNRPLCCLVLLIFTSFCRGTQIGDCSCGFYDASLNGVLTDSTIVYFNETDEVPSDLVLDNYENKYDYGWNALYREGASSSNVEIDNDTSAHDLQSLRMFCDSSDANHLVVGSSIRTARRDIFFGSFRALMRSPRRWFPGSALSMLVDHNRTEGWDVDIRNTQNWTDAWVSTLVEGQFPDRWFGVNYTTLEADGTHPWDYTEYRVDWTRHEINFYIGGQLYRSVTTKENGTLSSTPASLEIKHWSNGNKYSSAGPPYQCGEANVGWVRLFFNSSVTIDEQSKAFDERCKPSDACLTDDITLRGTTKYSNVSLDQWKQTHPKPTLRWIPISIDIAFGSLSTLLLLKTLQRRVAWGRIKSVLLCRGNRGSKPSANDSSSHVELVRDGEPGSKFGSGTVTPTLPSGMLTPASWAGTRTPKSWLGMEIPLQYSGMCTPEPQHAHSSWIRDWVATQSIQKWYGHTLSHVFPR